MKSRILNIFLIYILFISNIYLAILPREALADADYNPCNAIFYLVGFWFCPKHDEMWGGTNHSRRTDCLCPPYNKTDRSGCLKQFDLPEPFNVLSNRYCAEQTTDDFFNPQIRVRVQTCNIACWTLSDNLRGDGECTVYPGSLGIPLLRLCARIALPDDPEIGTPADDGYTYGWHLDGEGAPKKDPIYTGEDGKGVFMARPKVCAYWDPGFWDYVANRFASGWGQALTLVSLLINSASSLITPSETEEFMLSTGIDRSGIRVGGVGGGILRSLQATFQPDLWDLNPVKQSMHYHEGGIFIIFQWVISLFKLGLTGAGLVKSLIGMMPEGTMWVVYWIGILYWLLVAIIYIGEAIIIPVLEYLGNMNNIVSAALGCVLVPLGPFPPPYCNILISPPQIPRVQEICPTILVGNVLTTLAPTTGKHCVQSSVPNNIISNSVRVGFDELLPLCKGTDTPSDKCVKIYGSLVPSALHAMTNSLDTIAVCAGATTSAYSIPCVESPALVTKCAKDPEWCSQKVRVVYATNTGSKDLINDYYDAAASSCTPLNNSMCQKIWGVNIGYFKDLSVVFPSVESSFTDSARVSSPAVIKDSANTTVQVNASIQRKKVTLPSLKVVDQTGICVYDSFSNLVGCIARPVPPKPVVYECRAPGSYASCTSTYLNPAMVAKLQVGTYSTEGPLSVATSSGRGAKINLAGFDYDSFATDANYSTTPFSGSHSINPFSIYGTYKEGGAPYGKDGKIVIGAIYIKGLEYIAGKRTVNGVADQLISEYVIGGEQLCLSGYKFDDCLAGNTNKSCVLSKIINSNYVRCGKFYNDVISRYIGITLCTAEKLASYTRVGVVAEPRVPPAVGNNNVTIYRETATTGAYCYDYTGSAAGELCKTGYTTASRVNPAPSYGDILLDTDYFNYSKTMTINGDINDDIVVVRNKTTTEFGLCVDVPQPPPCPAIDISQANANNYATWPITKSGDVGTGQCIVGATPISATSLNRTCLIDKTTAQTEFEPLTASMGCHAPKCVVSLGDSLVWTHSGWLNVTANYAENKNYITGPDANGNYVIKVEAYHLEDGYYPVDDYFNVPVTYTPGPTSSPTVEVNITGDSSPYYMGITNTQGYAVKIDTGVTTMRQGLNYFNSYAYTRKTWDMVMTITINCHDK